MSCEKTLCTEPCAAPCNVKCPEPRAAACNEPCVVACPDSRVIIYPPPVVVTFPGPILTTYPQETVVGSTESAELATVIDAGPLGISAPFGAGGCLGYRGYGNPIGLRGSLLFGGAYGPGGACNYNRPYSSAFPPLGRGYCGPYSYRRYSTYSRGSSGPC
uniref:Keratin n=1 Tax=Anas platyrhynchos platyrhynchos TaxID=8840 RepID=A0A493TQY1_ANAPP